MLAAAGSVDELLLRAVPQEQRALRYGICCVVVSFAKRFMVSLTKSVG
jgi:hypothetical protein